MNRKLTLLQTVQRLEGEKLARYALNLGVKIDADWSDGQMRKAYADYVLSHPRELLAMLPMEDLRLLKHSEKDEDGLTRIVPNPRVTPIFVEYGLAEMETIGPAYARFTIPADFYQAVKPHLEWAETDEQNDARMRLEVVVVGVANLLGVVTQKEVRECIRQVLDNCNAWEARRYLRFARQGSLMLDSMEWREHGDDTAAEDVLFVSRYGWDDKAAMRQFVRQRSKDIRAPRHFTKEEVINAAFPTIGRMASEQQEAFTAYLTRDLGLDVMDAQALCFNIWYYRMQAGRDEYADAIMEATFLSFGLMRDGNSFSEEELEEGMKRLTAYANHLPLWNLRGFTASDYPSEAYVPFRRKRNKGTFKEILSGIVNDARLIEDLREKQAS